MWRVGQSYNSRILRQCYCSVQCYCVCLVTDVSIVVFLFIQITASKLMSDFRLSTFTVSIVSGKWVFGYVVLGSFTTRATKVLKILGGLVKKEHGLSMALSHCTNGYVMTLSQCHIQ